MGKCIVFLLLFIAVSCASRSTSSDIGVQSSERALKYQKLSKKALEARRKYFDKVDKKAKGYSLQKAKDRMTKAETNLEKYKAGMRPSTKHRHRTY